MRVSELLPRVKANSKTYHNLDKDAKRRFQRLYNHLKKNKERKIMSLYAKAVETALNDDALILDYCKKLKAMETAAQNLN